MGFGDLFKKSFGASAATPVDERALSGTSEDALASSLEKLADGERGWIPLAQAALLFSTEDRQYAFGELDDAGKNRLAIFAADHRCTPDFRPTEGWLVIKDTALGAQLVSIHLPLKRAGDLTSNNERLVSRFDDRADWLDDFLANWRQSLTARSEFASARKAQRLS
jgi:hypothetical protein